MILLDNDERYAIRMTLPEHHSTYNYETAFCRAQAAKILIELQSIYKLPDLKMEYDRMGEFIKELMEEIE